MTNVNGKWALITGANRGIGYRIAKFMASKGCNLILHSRSLEHTKDVLAQVSAMGVEAFDVEAELADINRKLRSTRRELTICRHVTEDIPKIRDHERLMREQEQYSKNAAREQTGENVKKENKGKWM